VTAFERQPGHWLFKFSPTEWLASALEELARATAAFEQRNVTAANALLKRAAGMALNAALIVKENPSWGRSYVEHLRALREDAASPPSVREAAARLLELKPSTGPLVSLRTRTDERALLDAARTIIAHAYAIVHGKPAAPAESNS
jgi:HEPN domain-containing protein